MRRSVVGLGVSILVIATAVVVVLEAQGTGTLFNLRGRTDAAGSLLTSAGAYTGPDGALQNFANMRLRTDANGYLITTTNSGGNFTVNNLVTTSTDGLLVQNTTPATAGVPVQMSPRSRWCGNAWDTAASESTCFFAETLPATAATPTATWKLGYSLNGAAATYPFTVNSAGTASLTTAVVSSTALLGGAGNTSLTSANLGQMNVLAGPGGVGVGLDFTVDSALKINNRAQTSGYEVSLGSATLGTCTGGTITTGSHNFAGGYTGNTSSSCIVNFGTPNWTNAPFCVAMSIASTTHPRVSAVSTSSMTITGGVSGEAITYLCQGRIGT